jgi:hypothetical protein
MEITRRLTGVYAIDHNPYIEAIDPAKYLGSLLDIGLNSKNSNLWVPMNINPIIKIINVPYKGFDSGVLMRFLCTSDTGQKIKTGDLLLTRSLTDSTIKTKISVEAKIDQGKHVQAVIKDAGLIEKEIALNFFLSYYFLTLGLK